MKWHHTHMEISYKNQAQDDGPKVHWSTQTSSRQHCAIYIFTRGLHAFLSFSELPPCYPSFSCFSGSPSHLLFQQPPSACFCDQNPTSHTLLSNSLQVAQIIATPLIHSTRQVFQFHLFYAPLHPQPYPFVSLLQNFSNTFYGSRPQCDFKYKFVAPTALQLLSCCSSSPL